MRQSNNRKSRAVTAFLYERLSRDDNLEGESYSIGNQKKPHYSMSGFPAMTTWRARVTASEIKRNC